MTIQDVASVWAGSTETVSGALSNPHRWSQKSRDVVDEPIQVTNQREIGAARNLRGRRACAALNLVPDI